MSLQALSTEADMEGWTDPWLRQSYPISEPAIDFLRGVADGLYTHGVELRVEYYLGNPRGARRLLVEHGFTAKYICYDDYPYVEYRMEGQGEMVVSHLYFEDDFDAASGGANDIFDVEGDIDPTRYGEDDDGGIRKSTTSMSLNRNKSTTSMSMEKMEKMSMSF